MVRAFFVFLTVFRSKFSQQSKLKKANDPERLQVRNFISKKLPYFLKRNQQGRKRTEKGGTGDPWIIHLTYRGIRHTEGGLPEDEWMNRQKRNP